MPSLERLEVRAEVDRVLWEVWDPIGLNENHLLREEYGQFLDGLLDVLSGGGGVAELEEFLRSCEEQILTEAGDPDRRMATAQAIANISNDSHPPSDHRADGTSA